MNDAKAHSLDEQYDREERSRVRRQECADDACVSMVQARRIKKLKEKKNAAKQ